VRKLLPFCISFVAIWFVSVFPAAAATTSITGLWDAAVVINQVEIPFRFEISQSGSQVQGFFFEGDRKIGSTSEAHSRADSCMAFIAMCGRIRGPLKSARTDLPQLR
jgi:hypothetical protein